MTQKTSASTQGSLPTILRLLRTMKEKDLSDSTEQMISTILTDASKTEHYRQTALKILDMLKTMKSEEDFVKKLSELET